MINKEVLLTLLVVLLVVVSSSASSTDLNYQFKNPSFSGVGAGAQWLTIENQEFSRKKAIQDKIEADLKAKATEEKNSILNRFVNNLQSRIYSQIAQQLTTNLFSGDTAHSGSFSLDGNKIDYTNNGDEITLVITDDAGNKTEITMPISGFKF